MYPLTNELNIVEFRIENSKLLLNHLHSLNTLTSVTTHNKTFPILYYVQAVGDKEINITMCLSFVLRALLISYVYMWNTIFDPMKDF